MKKIDKKEGRIKGDQYNFLEGIFIFYQNSDHKYFLYSSLIITMGIDSLLQLLKPITHSQHLSSFKNQTIGIDASVWLYKACYQSIKFFNLTHNPLTPFKDYQLTSSNYLLIMISLL